MCSPFYDSASFASLSLGVVDVAFVAIVVIVFIGSGSFCAGHSSPKNITSRYSERERGKSGNQRIASQGERKTQSMCGVELNICRSEFIFSSSLVRFRVVATNLSAVYTLGDTFCFFFVKLR